MLPQTKDKYNLYKQLYILNHVGFFFNILWVLENSTLCEHALGGPPVRLFLPPFAGTQGVAQGKAEQDDANGHRQ